MGGWVAAPLDERPELADRLDELDGDWPAFMRQGKTVRRYWESLYRARPQYQVVLLGRARDAIVAKGHALPIAWDGRAGSLPEGVDAVLKREVLDPAARPTTLCALAVVVAPEHRGEGLSGRVLEALRALAARRGLRDLVVPVRPTAKRRYPLTPIERYARWTDPRGLPFDPWLRVHARMGARIVGVAPRSMVVTGTVADWEAWSGLRFPDSGAYVVDGALRPVTIDHGADLGRYEEPNVWVHHP